MAIGDLNETTALVRPGTLAEACATLLQDGVVPVAGGAELLPRIKRELVRPRCLVDLSGLEELRGITASGDGVRIGAVTTLREVATSAELRAAGLSVVAEAAGRVASPQIRNRGTLGGNLCQDTRCDYYNQSYFWRQKLGPCLRLGGEVCHQRRASRRCVALFCSDLAPVCIALGAGVVLVGPKQERMLPLEEFYVAAGETALQKGECLAAVELPFPAPHTGHAYRRQSFRRAIDYPLAAVAVTISIDPATGFCRGARIVIGAVASTPVRAHAAEAVLAGEPLEARVAETAAIEAVRRLRPIPEASCPPRTRLAMVKALLVDGIMAAAGNVRE